MQRERTVIAEERVGGLGGEVLLAGREVRRDITLRPEPVSDGFAGAGPAMKFAGDIAADFNSHPAATVVVNPVHGVIGIAQSKGIADHGVPLAVEKTPARSPFRKPDQD